MTKKVQQIIKEIDSLESEEKGLLIQTLFAKGLVTPYVDPFALLRENIPATLSDKQVGETIDQALRRIRHTTPQRHRR
ncbi:MAG: hypothetical protein HY314_05985 [Acidobacteria bacterium]|nr:hypothetical protein [Acidobacteriota bacterium]